MSDIDPQHLECPKCKGPWLENYQFSHLVACEIGTLDRATVAGDLDYLQRFGGARTRPTAAEEDRLSIVFGSLGENGHLCAEGGAGAVLPTVRDGRHDYRRRRNSSSGQWLCT